MAIEYVAAKSIITNSKDDFWFGKDYNMNIYRGCNHGCIYCDSRSDVYGVENFDSVKVKKDALQIIEKELKSKRKKGVIAIGAMSDPYNALEKSLELTRESLKLIDKYGFGIALATKSDLVLRDIDLFKKIALHSPVLIKITITTSNDDLAKLIEPYAPSSTRRFKAIKILRENGIYSGILLMPILPFVNDTINNLEGILNKASYVDANFILPFFGVTQRTGQRKYYLDKLSLINESLSLKHDRTFNNNYVCNSLNAKELSNYFNSYAKKHQLKYKMKDIIKDYKKGYNQKQISLFEL